MRAVVVLMPPLLRDARRQRIRVLLGVLFGTYILRGPVGVLLLDQLVMYRKRASPSHLSSERLCNNMEGVRPALAGKGFNFQLLPC